MYKAYKPKPGEYNFAGAFDSWKRALCLTNRRVGEFGITKDTTYKILKNKCPSFHVLLQFYRNSGIDLYMLAYLMRNDDARKLTPRVKAAEDELRAAWLEAISLYSRVPHSRPMFG